MLRVLVGVLLVLMVSRAVLAQTTTGALELRITGEDGQPIVAAQVFALGLGRPHHRTSDARGYVRFPALLVGSYTVQVRRLGYRPVRLDGVIIRLGQTMTLQEVRLDAQAADLPEIIIEAVRPLIDVVASDASTTLNADTYGNLPISRRYHDIATLVAHNNVSFLGDQVNVAGGTGLENSYFIDGVNVTDVLGVRTLGTRLPYNFIKEVEVRTGGYEAEHRSTLGGVMNVVTHAGTDTLRGEVLAFGLHNRLSAATRQGIAQPRTRGAYAADLGVSLGGPVVRERLWFFAAYNPSMESEEVLLPGAGYHRDREEVHSFAGKLTWQPTRPTTIVVTAFGDPSTRRGVGATFGAYGPVRGFANADPALGQLRRGGITVAVNAQHLRGERVLLEAFASRVTIEDVNRPATPRGAAEYFFTDQSTGIRSGGYPERILYQSARASLSASATFLLARHTPKIGVTYVDNGLRQDATFRASALLDPSAPLYFTFLSSAQGEVRSRVPSVYVQDSWLMTERLRLNAGVRWDGQFLMDSRGRTAVKILDQYQPRLGLVYQPGKLGTQKVFATFGRFYQDLHLAAVGLHHDHTSTFSFTFYPHDPRQNPAGGNTTYNNFEPAGSGLKGQHQDEWTVGYERQTGRNVKVGVRGIVRRLREGIENGFDSVANAIVLGNPGRGRLSMFPRMRRNYSALELTVEGAPSAKLRFLGSYVLSRTRGNYSGLFNSDFGYLYANRNGAFDYVETLQNATGDLPNDRRHVLKLAGSYRLLPGLTGGMSALWATGTPLDELGASRRGPAYATFLRPRGSAGRTPALLDVNVRLAYAFRRSNAAKANPTVLLDVFHIGTDRVGVGFDQRRYLSLDTSGQQALPNPTYGLPTRYAPPVSARVGIVVPF